jgi:hypothetical protein
VTPSGYVAEWNSGVPQFYQKAPGLKKFVFDLKKTAPSKDYSIVAIADPQTRSPKHFSQFAGKPLEDVCQTTKSLDGVAVGLALGDICWDEFDRIDDYKAEIVRTGIPFYPVVGNHDHELEVTGDLKSTALYREKLGPENYAFFLGNDVVIVVDNIIYNTQKNYVEGYADHVIKWVKGLERQIPFSSDLYIAQHCPLRKWFEDNAKIANANDLLEVVRGHKVTFISGHTHINNVLDYEDYDEACKEHGEYYQYYQEDAYKLCRFLLLFCDRDAVSEDLSNETFKLMRSQEGTGNVDEEDMKFFYLNK